ncbi:MAG: M56 family metallopeptidase, partial [Clostridia bacterium]|nr:M56 family metallopeptidase [Clostridia bacterium]
SPFTFGLIRPVVVIPEGLLLMNPGDVRAVVYHELIHIKRFDAPLKTLVALCCCVHWFNPLCWIMAKVYARDTELACDAAVMRKIGHDGRKEYASALLNLQCSDKGLLSGGFSRLAIKERIVWIMKYRRFSLAATCLAAALVILMAAAFATSPEEIARAVENITTTWPFHAYNEQISPSDFHLSSVDVSGDDKILLSGYIDTGAIKMGKLITCDVEAFVDWERLEVSRDALDLDTYTLNDSVYTDAKFIDDETIAVLRNIPMYTEYSAMLIKGGVEDDVNIMKSDCLSRNEYGIYPVPGGLLINGKPDPATVRVTRMDMQGEKLWQLLLAEPIRFNGILTQNGVHLAFGYKAAQQSSTPVIIAFDDLGEILWRYDGVTDGEFTDALITDDGNIVLVGFEPDVFEGRAQGIIASFDMSGHQLFASEYIYNDSEKFIDAKLTSVVQSSDGYTACINNPDDYAVRLATFDAHGNTIIEQDMSTAEMILSDNTDVRAEKVELISAAGEVFLIIYGTTGEENEWGDPAYVTVLTQVLPDTIEVNPEGEVDL